MSARGNKKSKQLKQMEDAVLGFGGGGAGGGIGGPSGLGGSSDGLATAGLSAGGGLGGLGGAGGGLGGGGGVGGTKSNVNALADLEREVKRSIGTDDNSPSNKQSGGKKKKKKNELEMSLAQGLSIAPSKDSMASETTAKYGDATLGGNDPLDDRDLDEEFGTPRSGGGGGGGHRGFGSYTGVMGERCGDCMSWSGRNKKLIGLVSLVAVAIGVSVGTAKAVQNGKSSGGASAAATVKSAPVVLEEPEVEVVKSSEILETTTSTTLFPPGASRQDQIIARIISLGYTEDYNLLDPEDEEDEDFLPSPMFQAVQWLANEDPMALDAMDPYLPHRYALAAFWYATYEDAARYDEENPPSEDDAEFANWDREDHWMSEKGICLWYGVKCWPNADHDDTFDGNHKVTYLNLTSNNIRGYIPDEMWRILTDIRHLDLSDNVLTGDLSPEIGRMIHVEDLRLGTNELTGEIPPEIADLTILKDLYLESNWLEGPLPTEIGLLTNLRHLGLYKNWFNGTIPYEFETLTGLQSLYLDINEMSGDIPDYLFWKLPALMDLRLGQNQLEGPIPEIPTGEQTALKILYLDHNELTGDIPTSISELKHLNDLHLYKNELTGPLPASLGKLSDLDRLFLDHNMLSGEIPLEWADLDDLEELYLYSNDLSGPLPGSVVAGMVDLRQLKVGDNSLYGKVPTELGSMYKLESIWLESNVFSGELPDLSDLHKLESLRIHDNGLVGAVSAPTCDLLRYNALEELSADCAPGDDDGAPPQVECECCTSCPTMEAEVQI